MIPANSVTANQAVQALLDRVVDYAGLFPPAKLEMAATVANYADYVRSDDAWMLGRLIIPAARLDEFARAAARDELKDAFGEAPWDIAALTAPADSAEFAADLERIPEFNREYGRGLACIDVLEIKTDTAAAIDAALDLITGDLFPFFEFPIEHDPRGLIAALADGDAGAKVRTGGVTADAYPKPEQLARFIAACAAARVPFKATAGLHQPLRHFSEALRANEFGFLNVFAAGCLAWAGEIDETDLRNVLVETDPAAILLDDRGLFWRGRSITSAQIAQAREEFAVSFGSCSFDEPRAALRALKLLPVQ